jgi:hypothetical protein
MLQLLFAVCYHCLAVVAVTVAIAVAITVAAYVGGTAGAQYQQ